ncbi:MAG TPA: alpha/beta family hydrolase [Ornithinibacter sp.]|nr:alpha/beta family hydrolase [Ornithinibacter sp.]
MSDLEEARLVDTPLGPARVTTSRPVGVLGGALVLGHGAGGLRWTLDVLATRDAAVAAGWVVVLVDQPWRVAGKKLGPAPASLDRAWLPVLAALAPELGTGPLVVGGRSAGARVACRTAAAVGASAVVALSFPLHPPGRPESSRAAELATPATHGIPVHVVQGRTDPFGSPDEVAAVLPPGATLDVVTGAHSIGGAAQAVAALVVRRLPTG